MSKTGNCSVRSQPASKPPRIGRNDDEVRQAPCAEFGVRFHVADARFAVKIDPLRDVYAEEVLAPNPGQSGIDVDGTARPAKTGVAAADQVTDRDAIDAAAQAQG